MAHFGILLQISGKAPISGQKTAKRGFTQIFGLCVLMLPGRSIATALKGGYPRPPSAHAVKAFSQCVQCIRCFSFYQVPTCHQVIKVSGLLKRQSRKNKKPGLECSRPIKGRPALLDISNGQKINT